MNQIQNFRQERFGHLELKIEAYLGSEICHLEFVIPMGDVRLESGRENTEKEIHEGASNCSDPWGGRDGQWRGPSTHPVPF
jgi:hypothetical protein